MAYQKPALTCDACWNPIADGSEVVCRQCYTKLENKTSDQDTEISELMDRIAEIEKDLGED